MFASRKSRGARVGISSHGQVAVDYLEARTLMSAGSGGAGDAGAALMDGPAGTSYAYTASLKASAPGATTRPAVPTKLLISALGPTQVSISWSAGGGSAATGFTLQRAKSGGSFVQIAQTAATTFIDSTAADGTTYTYRVLAYNAAGSSASVAGSVTTAMVPPANLQVTTAAAANGRCAVQLSWKNGSATATGVKVMRSTDGLTFTTLKTLSGSASGYTDTVAMNGASYSYRLQATSLVATSAMVAASVTVPLSQAVPTNLKATVAANVAKVTLSWTGSSASAQGYVIERSSDGTTFAEIARVGLAVSSYTDVGALAAGTTYTYRIRSYDAAGVSAASAAMTAKTANFRVFGDLAFSGKPDLTKLAIENIHVTGVEFFSGSYPNYDDTKPDEAATRALADKVVAAHQILVIDIEHWPIDVTYAGGQSPDLVLANLKKLNQLADWLKSEQPTIQFGFFAILPTNRPTGTDTTSQQINSQIDALISKVTAYFPCYYASSYFNENAITWQARVQSSLLKDHQAANGKPVYPFIWMNMDDCVTPVSGDFWRVQVETTRGYADGVVIWGGWQFAANRDLLGHAAWDASAAWWQGTSDFISASSGIALVAPSGLSAQRSPGVVHLSWSATGGSSPIAIERSKDGVNYTVVGIVAGSSTSYDDALVDGSLYQYRLRTTNGTTDSSPSNAVSIQSIRDALRPIQAESANAYQSNNITFSKLYLINPANDWVKYSSVDFGTGVTQFTARVSDCSTWGNTQTIELHLDSVNGPVIGVYKPTYSGLAFQEQTTAITATSGVHDLYLVTKNWGISYLDWVKFSK